MEQKVYTSEEIKKFVEILSKQMLEFIDNPLIPNGIKVVFCKLLLDKIYFTKNNDKDR